MIVKMVRADGTFDLIDRVKQCSFRRSGEGAVLTIEHDNGLSESRVVERCAYALNENGRTIDTFNPR